MYFYWKIIKKQVGGQKSLHFSTFVSLCPARPLPHVLLITPLLLCAHPSSAALPGVNVSDWPRWLLCQQCGPLWGWRGPRGPRYANRCRSSAVTVLEQLAEGGDVNLRHLESLGFGELLVALQVWDDAPQTVKGDVESQHPSPLSGVGSEASPSLRTLQSALVRVEVMQCADGGAQPELHDGARRVLVFASSSSAPCPRSLLWTAPLQQSIDVGVERCGTRGAGSTVRLHWDKRRKQTFTRRHLSCAKLLDHWELQQSNTHSTFLIFYGRIYGRGARSACCGGVARVVCCLMNRAKVRSWRSINQVHQKRIRSVSLRCCGVDTRRRPSDQGGEERRKGKRKGGRMRGDEFKKCELQPSPRFTRRTKESDPCPWFSF